MSRYADVRDMSIDWHTYSSASGSVLEIIRRPDLLELMRNMLFEDPPIHDEHRSVLNRALTPRRVADLEVRVRELCADMLDPLVGSGGFDFVRDFGARLPMLVIGSLLGVPDEDQDMVRVWADETLHRDEGETQSTAVEAHLRMHEYFTALVAERRARPRDDFITVLTQAPGLSDGELVGYVGLIAGAGNETVARLMGWAAVVLAANPDQRALLAEDPSLLAGGVEELLRYEAPSPVQSRLMTHDVELYGEKVPAGSVMVMITGSAGRDEREYPDPDRFDVRRNGSHLSFGHGVHFCLGAALARLEGRIGLEEILRRFPEWGVESVEMVHTSTVRGPASVRIAV